MTGQDEARYAPTDEQAEQAGEDAAEQTQADLDDAGMDEPQAPASQDEAQG